MRLSATLVIDGPRPLLEALRMNLAAIFASECPSVLLRNESGDSGLRFTLVAPDGLPYPQLVAASVSQPECVFTLEWNDDQASGVTTIQGGRVEAATTGAGNGAATPNESLQADELGALVLGMALIVDTAYLLGYAVTRDAETYFRVASDPAASQLLTVGGTGRQWDECWRMTDDGRWQLAGGTPTPIDAPDLVRLEPLAAAYRARWLWFDADPPEKSIIERHRAEQAGLAVHAINVQSRARALLQRAPAQARLPGSLDWVPPLLARTWAAPDIPATTSDT